MPDQTSESQIPRTCGTAIQRFRPRNAWFAISADGIHGVAHEARVLVWTQTLAAMVPAEGLVVDPAVLGWAAALHDTQRFDDGIDPEHGARAAEWTLTQASWIAPDPIRERVAYLCRWHVPTDRRAPEMTPELAVFKDADALDRWRIYDLDPAHLRTRSANRLLEASHSLWHQTRRVDEGEPAFDRIVQAAIELGLLSGSEPAD